MNKWFVTEEIFQVSERTAGVLRYYQDGWYAAVGEVFSNEPNDNLTEDNFFDSKREAKKWIRDRLRKRGYIS